MQVIFIKNDRLSVDLGSKSLGNGNFVDILTGPNGCGKTEILDSIIRFFNERPKQHYLIPENLLQVNYRDRPRKIVVQTFSPFSRFPAPRPRKVSFKYNFDERAKECEHISIGLHKTSKNFDGGLSTKILEDSIFRLANSPERVETLFSVLKGLDFNTRFELIYEVRAQYRDIFELYERTNDIKELIAKIIETSQTAAQKKRWRKLYDSGNFLATLEESVKIALNHRYILLREFCFRAEIDISNYRRDFYLIQAFSLLRKYDFLSLECCLLYSPSLGKYLNISETSSGQQQMLCALFGLATSVEDDCLVLLDEPELSLHPEWQLKFVDALFELLSNVSNTHTLIATHSPLVVQRASALGADIIQLGEGSSRRSRSTTDQTSVSIEQALVDVFHTPITDSTHVSNEIFNAIVQGETGDKSQKDAALNNLIDLQRIYNESRDQKTIKLLSEAIRLIKMPNTPTPDNQRRD